MNQDRFAKNLKHIRENNNMTQQQLADKLFVSQQAVQKWEKGQIPQADRLNEIADVLNTTIYNLLYDNENLENSNYCIAIDSTEKETAYLKDLENIPNKTFSEMFKIAITKEVLKTKGKITTNVLLTELEYNTFISLKTLCPEYDVSEFIKERQKEYIRKKTTIGC